MAYESYTLTQLEAAFKVRHDTSLTNLFYGKARFPAYCKKPRNGLSGRHAEVIINGKRNFAAGTFAVSKENAQRSNPQKFKLNAKKNYQHGYLDAMTLLASKENGAALDSMFDHSIDMCLEGWTRRAEFCTLHSGGGARGQIATGGISGATITLVDKEVCRWLEEGMPIEFYPDNGTGAAGTARGTGGSTTLIVSDVNPDTGVVTFTANVSTISGGGGSVAAGDYLFLQGDYQNVMSSIFSWIPYLSADLSSDFLGVDQTTQTLVRAGSRIPVGGQSTHEGIISGLARARSLGQQIDTIWLGPTRYADLLKDIDSKAQFSKADLKVADLSCGSIRFHGGEKGMVNIVELPGLPQNGGLMTKDNTWEIRSIAEWPHFESEDGDRLKHVMDTDEYVYIMAGFGELACTEPRNQGHIQWDVTPS